MPAKITVKTEPQYVPSVCPHDCTSTCALDVERLDDNTIGRVRGGQRNAYTAGVICEKVARYAERVHHPDRLLTPMRRTGPKGSQQFEAVSWDDALDLVAETFIQKTQRYGTETVWPYYYAGTMGHVQRDGINRLRNVMKYSGFYSTICVTLSDTGWIAGTGAKRGANLLEAAQHSDLIVIWGGNPVNTQVNVMTHVMQAKKRGAKLVVVDPYRTGTASRADIHLAVKPGTDGALACAVMHVLFKEGYADRDYMAAYTDAPADLEAHLQSRTPAWAAAITGLSEQEIISFARLYGNSKAPFIRAHHGFSRSRNGAVNMHAVTCLPAVTGAWKHRGGGALYANGVIYPLNKTLIEGTDVVDPAIRMLDQSRLGPILTGDPDALKNGPPVTAMHIQNTNPAVVCPELGKVHEGMMRDDLFMCVHEQFMTETARLADVVLPATMFLEHDDFYTASGHTVFQVARKVIEAPGECRENHWVNNELARRLGASHRGMEMTAWEMVDQTLQTSGMWGAQQNFEAGGQDFAPSFETSNFLDGFAWPDKRFRFKPDWAAFGGRHQTMPALPDHFDVIDNASDDKPFRLVAAPARTFLNTSFTETPGSLKREKKPSLMMHEQDCKAMGVNDGDAVRLGNDRGDINATVQISAGQQPGVVILEGIWPNQFFKDGLGVNALTSSEPGFPNGGAVFHDTAVWVRPQS
ncbi:MAG: molybdopterin oxidoreductase family protein [Burkholderiaceae bacterium]